MLAVIFAIFFQCSSMNKNLLIFLPSKKKTRQEKYCNQSEKLSKIFYANRNRRDFCHYFDIAWNFWCLCEPYFDFWWIILYAHKSDRKRSFWRCSHAILCIVFTEFHYRIWASVTILMLTKHFVILIIQSLMGFWLAQLKYQNPLNTEISIVHNNLIISLSEWEGKNTIKTT